MDLHDYEYIADTTAKDRVKRYGGDRDSDLYERCFAAAFDAINTLLMDDCSTPVKDLWRVARNACRNVFRERRRTHTTPDALLRTGDDATVVLTDVPYDDNTQLLEPRPIDVELGDVLMGTVAEMLMERKSGRSIRRDLGISRHEYDKIIERLRQANAGLHECERDVDWSESRQRARYALGEQRGRRVTKPRHEWDDETDDDLESLTKRVVCESVRYQCLPTM